MNLKFLNDQTLLNETLRLVKEEREILTSVLHHLKEIERRRLYSSLRYSSLFDYAIKELKYSEAQAGRRISAMRLLRDLPEIETKIEKGNLSLTNLVLAQTLFSKEKQKGQAYSHEQKLNVLGQLEDKSTREAQKIVFEISPDMKMNDLKKKELGVGLVVGSPQSLGFEAIEDMELRNKLIQVKGFFAHAHPHLTLTELLHKLCDNEISKKTKLPSAAKVEKALAMVPKEKALAAIGQEVCEPVSAPTKISQAEIRRQVWRRDQGQCCKCGSRYALEIDHVVPKAVGGESSVENLRLLCRKCNQRAAIQYFGQRKMDVYLNNESLP